MGTDISKWQGEDMAGADLEDRLRALSVAIEQLEAALGICRGEPALPTLALSYESQFSDHVLCRV